MNQGNATPPEKSATPPGPVPRDGAAPSRCHCIDSASLFRGARELVITHNGERYSLRVTRNEKLILTK
jgi:hemin uptake protein HemP